jgi:hypothetical protein
LFYSSVVGFATAFVTLNLDLRSFKTAGSSALLGRDRKERGSVLVNVPGAAVWANNISFFIFGESED